MAGHPERCSVCNHADRDAAEKAGAEALAGAISWRSAAMPFGLRHESLKNHMEKHVVAVAAAEANTAAQEQMLGLIARSREELLEQFEVVPADIKPLILVAIQNLDGLLLTKPSMETLIKSLKTIQEMTGMKQEQRMMLEMARSTRRAKPIQVANERQPALPAPVEEAEVVPD